MNLITESLKIIPLDLNQFSLLLKGMDRMEKELGLTASNENLDEDTQIAMEGLYEEALKRPNSYLWYTNWQIILNSENKAIGSACFMKEPDENGIVEVGYGINSKYRNNGYATEAIQTMCNWALEQPLVRAIIAETDKGNYPSHKVLQKCGMTRYKESDDSIFWRLNLRKNRLTDLTNEELWQLFPITLSEHKDYWTDYYKIEEKLLIETIGKGKESIARINHIGSSAVPNLLSKPTIDILLEISNDVNTERLIDIIESIGYIYTYQPNNPAPHMMFMKGYTLNGFEEKVFHLHVRYFGDWDELYFRDYLIQYPKVSEQYGQLKLELRDKFKHDRDAYTEAKTDFIRKYTDLVRKEFPNKYL